MEELGSMELGRRESGMEELGKGDSGLEELGILLRRDSRILKLSRNLNRI
jgi:hypothetical protein